LDCVLDTRRVGIHLARLFPSRRLRTIVVIGVTLGLVATNLLLFPASVQPATADVADLLLLSLVAVGEELIFRGDLYAALE